MAACCECSCPACAAWSCMTASANLVWASDEWDLADEPEHHQGRHRECAVGRRGIRRRRAHPGRRPRRVLLRDSRRAHRVAGRRQPDRPLVGHAIRGAAPADRAPAGAAGIGVPAARALAAFEIRLPRTRSRCARTRPRSHAGNLFASIGGRERYRRIQPHHEDRDSNAWAARSRHCGCPTRTSPCP